MTTLSQIKASHWNRPPYLILEWNDNQTEARGWLVIDTLRGGGCGGGLRMRKGLTCYEVIDLAKTMSLKFTVSGPAIGGAKSGINFDPNSPQKDAVLKRWFSAIKPYLYFHYGTGGDLNIDEGKDVLPNMELIGIKHPQEGIVRGHISKGDERLLETAINRLKIGVPLPISSDFDQYLSSLKNQANNDKPYSLVDMLTGFGVIAALDETVLNLKLGRPLRLLVEGFGAVGLGVVYYAMKYGYQIVGISSANGYVKPTKADTFSEEELRFLIEHRLPDKNLPTSLPSSIEFCQRSFNGFFDIPADVFIPAAKSYTITDEVYSKISKTVKLIVPGANYPFGPEPSFEGFDQQKFAGIQKSQNTLLEKADSELIVIPDFIANAGVACLFAALMDTSIELSCKEIFDYTERRIRGAIKEIFQQKPGKRFFWKIALQIAIDKLKKG